tara:strand:- start:1009 stop:1641 length:633 start_codon:yes stop_codon:yes gene_type:complete
MNKNLALLQDLLSQVDFDVWHPYEPKFIGPETRTVALFNEVSSDTALALITQLKHLAEMAPEEPITLLLNTEGGSLTDALAIYDCISQLCCPVVCLTTGLCASAGLLILASCDYRVATPNTTFFYHEPICSTQVVLSEEQLKGISKHYLFSKEVSDKLLRKRAGMKVKDWNKNFKNKTNFYFTAEEARSFNFIDALTITDKIEFEIDEDY